MKLKILCHSQQSMWLKRMISKGLIVGMLFNNIGYSFANAKSLDRRYETFEGNNITIDNVLEEDKVNVEIEGNTMVNVLNYETSDDFAWLSGTVDDDGYIEIIADGEFKNFFINKEDISVKPSTTYTYFLEIAENTLIRDDGSSLNCIRMGGTHETSYPSYWKDCVWISGGITGKYKFTLTTKDSFEDVITGDRGYINWTTSGKLKMRYMIIEGNHMDKDLDYFKGIKSVGQNEKDNHSIEIKSSNKNLFNTNSLYTQDSTGNHANADFEVSGDSIFMSKKTSSGNFVGVKIKCKKGQPYTIGFIGGVNNAGTEHSIYVYNNKLWGSLITKITNGSNTDSVHETIIPTTDEIYVGLYMFIGTQIGEVIEYKNVFVYEGTDTEYERYQEDTTSLQIKEPFRSLPRTRDNIIKKDGQWVIERNCKEILLDGSNDEHWSNRNTSFPSDTTQLFCFNTKDENAQSATNVYCNRFISKYTVDPDTRDSESIFTSTNGDGYGIYIRINNSKLETLDVAGFRKWLSLNPTRVVYPLAKPIYEPLNIPSNINIHEEITYIWNNSDIPANMKITVDRVVNRAQESIELAKNNLTIENISQARYWTNLMKESILKDSFQNEINNETNIEDLTMDKKSTTANVDVYIKSKNGLSMTLSTNSIIFDEFGGTEDMEKLNAVEVTVDSSLPYNLNSYLMTEIKNENGTNIIPKELFNIKINGENDYKAFANINEKLVLKEDCPRGENRYGIDLILKGSLTHEADVYKTTIKFEAEQK